MVICRLNGGLGNQFYQYTYARTLAHNLNTELKLDVISCKLHDSKPKHSHDFDYYHFDVFNIVPEFATLEEINRVKENGVTPPPLPNLKDFQGDIYIAGSWMMNNGYYFSIIDTIRKEFTLNRPFNPIAESWRQKILAAECAVSMHFRQGDYVYAPDSLKAKAQSWLFIPTFDYYHTCIDILKQRYKNLTVFVFSNNIQWVKENLRLDVPIEFVEGCETDDEEWLLISLCKHNISASSTFSSSAGNLNANPDKKMFSPGFSNSDEVKKFHDSLTPAKKDALLNTNGRIRIPVDCYNQPKVTIQPFFSVLLVVNDDIATIAGTLDSLLKQDYRWHELIIIDNASTDGSNKICKDTIAGRENVIFKKLYSKVTNADAWNMALDMAQGRYVSFITGGGYNIQRSHRMVLEKCKSNGRCPYFFRVA